MATRNLPWHSYSNKCSNKLGQETLKKQPEKATLQSRKLGKKRNGKNVYIIISTNMYVLQET